MVASQTNSILSTFKDIADETLWPTRCVLCDTPGTFLCKSCASKLPFIDIVNACHVCGEPYGSLQCCGCSPVHANLPEEPRDSYKPEFTQAYSCVVLNEDTGRIITVYKDAGERSLAAIMAYFISKYIPKAWTDTNTKLTYIPSTNDAIKRRGFDHAQILASHVAGLSKLKLMQIFKNPESIDQRQLSRSQRQKNMKSTLQVGKDITGLPHNIIIVDDVYTTGATLNAAAIKLKEHNVKNIYCITFARTF